MASELSDIVRAGFDKACKCFTERVKSLGFVRGKKRQWYRLRALTADFIHFHRGGCSYGAPLNAEVEIRVHLGIRVLNARSENLHLNGPDSDTVSIRERSARYHLRFNAKSGSMYERCCDDLIRFVVVCGEPWFARLAEPSTLLQESENPLRDEDKNGLRESLDHQAQPKRIAASYKLLGVKELWSSQSPAIQTFGVIAMTKTKSIKSTKVGDETVPAIRFSTRLFRPKATAEPADWTFLPLPKEASSRLPSRGMVSIEGTLNGAPLQATLEPDGQGGHWLKVDRKLREAAGVDAGDVVTLEIAPVAEEPEPTVPPDLKKALAMAPSKARDVWADITPAARRDFIHWIVSPKKPETRVKRVATACDMLAKGKRRPCCFDRSGKFDKSLSCPVAEDESSERKR